MPAADKFCYAGPSPSPSLSVLVQEKIDNLGVKPSGTRVLSVPVLENPRNFP